jgi:hypothetical protein
LLPPLFAALAAFVSSCGKRPTEAERNAEIERQVQERLNAEHRADEQKKLAQRQVSPTPANRRSSLKKIVSP